MLKKFILPTSLLAGTIIGAGIFSLPFVFEKSGLITGLVYLVFLTAIASLIHLMYADIIVRTPEHHHRFPGYAKIYLGKNAGLLANVVTFVALFLTLTVYLVLSVSFLNLITPHLPLIFKILIFWILGSLAVFLGIRKAAFFESATTIITLLMIFLIFFLGFFSHPEKILSLNFVNSGFLFFPFGAVLFALLGESAIPPLIAYFRKENMDFSKIKKIIVWGAVIPAFFYLLFVFGILGLSGKTVSEDAVSGLIGVTPPIILMILGVFGFISLWDSYAAIGTDAKKIMEYEWKLPKLTVSLIIIFAPLILYFSGLQNFLELVSVVGGILYGLWGLLTVLVWRKAAQIESQTYLLKKISPIIVCLLILIFVAGIIYHAVNFL